MCPQVHIPIDRTSKEPKGVAYVTFTSSAFALSAYESLDKKPFQGRLLHILGAVDRRGSAQAESAEVKKTVKGDKDTKRKAGAGKEFNWSMLYMNVSWSFIWPSNRGLLITMRPERRCGIVGGRSNGDIQVRHFEPRV